MSSGLAYETGLFSNTDEVVALNKIAARLSGLYSSHMRDEDDEVESAVRELIDIGTRSGGPAHMSHAKISTMRLWGAAPRIIAQLDATRAAGVDVSADVEATGMGPSSVRSPPPHFSEFPGPREDVGIQLEREPG